MSASYLAVSICCQRNFRWQQIWGVGPGTPRLPGLTLADADALVASALADGGMPITSRIAVAKARTALMALQSSGSIKLPGEIVSSIQHLQDGDFIPSLAES
ncbi:hypothetical protein [Nocardia colli]|uniref:hypothetical protein n=1 Tax=Nocardia colli TaxID=2545717 RepID=UPI0035DF6560